MDRRMDGQVLSLALRLNWHQRLIFERWITCFVSYKDYKNSHTYPYRQPQALHSRQGLCLISPELPNQLCICFLCACAKQPSVQLTSHLLTEPISHVRTAILSLGSVTMQDAGSYNCEAMNEKGTREKPVWVDIYGRSLLFQTPFSILKTMGGTLF